MGTPGFAGELTTRHFNLTHEWGMELIYYLVLSRTDFRASLVPHWPADLLLRDAWRGVPGEMFTRIGD